ncbi:MAG: DUF6088 family protein [Bacteroidota bacterium]|uniref:DUF6088 family protein n=1 Tax=Mucilaginibacter lappiensis TaxID=354630 RepID=UPI00334FCAD1
MNSIHQNIATRIKGYAIGSILFPCDFRGLGSEDAIKMSLSRHARNGLVERLGQGVYLKVKAKGKTAKPTMEQIALAIAKKEKIKIKPSGEFALHKLGMTANLPDDLIYITDGEPRNILIGSKRLIFKSTTPKKLRLSNGISGLLIQGLEELGKDALNDQLKNQVSAQLKKEDEKNVMADLQLAPAWIYDLLYKLNQQLTR